MYKVSAKNKEQLKEGYPVSTAIVENRDITASVNVNGHVYIERSASLKPEGKVYIAKQHVVLGQTVKKGDLLMEMDTKALKKRLERKILSLEIEKERLKQYKQEGDIEISNVLKSSKIDYLSAEDKYVASKALLASGAISQQAFQDNKDIFEKAKMTYEKAKNDFKTNSNSTKIKIQELTIKSTVNEISDLEEEIQKKNIVSPFDGVVTQINFKENELFDESNTLVQVQDFNSRVIKALIPESDINKLDLGQEVTVTSNALKGKVFKGQIMSIAPGTMKKSGKNIAYTEVVIQLEEFDKGLKEGFMVNLSIVTADKKGVLSVNSDALSTDIDGHTTVTKVTEDGSEEKIVIQTGTENLMYTEIVDGDIKAGDHVLISSGAMSEENQLEEDMDIGF